MMFCGFRRIGLYCHKPSNHDEGGVLVFIAVAKTGRFVRMDFFDKVHMPDVILVKRCCKNNGEIIRAALQGRLSQEQLNREMENEEYELFLRIRSQSRTGGPGRKVFRPRWEKYPTEVYRRKVLQGEFRDRVLRSLGEETTLTMKSSSENEVLGT